MKYSIENGCISVAAENAGGELVSVRRGDTEYLWQRDPGFWHDSSPNIFPYIARLTEGKYTFGGETYEMKIHGFVKYAELKLTAKTDTSMTFSLEDNDDTYRQYPWHFLYSITYSLDGDTLLVETRIENRDEKTMYFGVGGHPGFNVPLEDGLGYEDYFIELPEAQAPVRIGFTQTCFRTGWDEPYALDEKKRIPLAHTLFENDAIVLKGAGQKAVLGSDKGTRALVVSWDHPYLGIWSRTSEAPYVCIEPWNGLPSHDQVIEDFEKQEDLVSLEKGGVHKSFWKVQVL